ncbi:peptidoglycan-binding domain-containing protein [Zavarzinia sp. CC-PAN008]|uniref:peptidoglycan-binding domain-containing protein n=1 Tax=Zavarzinia sp. CC-PAN008 TaxID=3243332 RepID=UPI003F743545
MRSTSARRGLMRLALAVALLSPLPALAQGLTPELAAPYISGIQSELTAHGFDAGAATGAMDRRTERAIRAYQQAAGLPVTGEPSPELLDHLKFTQPRITARAAPAPYGGGYSDRARAQSGLVGAIQEELLARGYNPGRPDGLPGPRTRAAAQAFQRDAGLPPTGILNEALLADLQQASPAIRGD